MRQTLVAMFSNMVRLDKPDPLLHQRLHKLCLTMLCQSSKTAQQPHGKVIKETTPGGQAITPQNIALVLELFRFAAKYTHEPCAHLKEAFVIGLDLVLPQQYSSSSGGGSGLEVTGFQNNPKMAQMLYADVCKSVCGVITNERVPNETKQLFREHIESKTGILWYTFCQIASWLNPTTEEQTLQSDQQNSKQTQSVEESCPYWQSLAPLLAFLPQANSLVSAYLPKDLKNISPVQVSVLRHTLNSHNIQQRKIDELAILCQRNIKRGRDFRNDILASFGLLLKLSLLPTSGGGNLHLGRIFMLFMNDMFDREQPLISLEQLAQVLSLIVDVLRETLFGTSAALQKEALNAIAQLINIAIVYCQESQLSGMNKQVLMPQLIQIQKQHARAVPDQQQQSLRDLQVSSQSSSLPPSQQQPLYWLYEHTKDANIFGQFIIGLMTLDQEYNRVVLRMQNESTSSYKFVTKALNYTQELADQQSPQIYEFLVMVMQRVEGLSFPAGFLSRYVLTLPRVSGYERVCQQIVAHTDDYQGMFDDFFRDFRRKKLQQLLGPTATSILKTLPTLTAKVRFTQKLISVWEHLNQQGKTIPTDDCLKILESITDAFVNTSEKLPANELSVYKQSILGMWLLLTVTQHVNRPEFKAVLTRLAKLTPVLDYDAEFALQVRSQSKSEAFVRFYDESFQSLNSDLLDKQNLHLRQAIETNARLNESSSIQHQNHQDSDPEDMEVGSSLIFTEKVFLAWFIRISLLKIEPRGGRPNEQYTLGASFIEQTISSFANESNFNVIVTQSNLEQITLARMTEINTPFGKQLHCIAKALMAEHACHPQTDWSDDYCLILRGMCSNSWSQRLISEEMSRQYQFKQASLPAKVLSTYSQLLNAIQTNLAENYSGLALQTVTQDGGVLVLPDDHEVCTKLQEELVRLLGQQYVSVCLLGNRINTDLTIRQIVEDVCLSTCQKATNVGERCLQSLAQLYFPWDKLSLNLHLVREKFENWDRANHYQSEVIKVYDKIKQSHQSGGNLLALAGLQQKQTAKLTQVRPFGEPVASNLQMFLRPYPLPAAPEERKPRSLKQLQAEAKDLVIALQMFESATEHGFSRQQITELLPKHLMRHPQHFSVSSSNGGGAALAKGQILDCLEAVVFQMASLHGCAAGVEDAFTVTQTVQLLAACPHILLKYLTHLETRRPDLMRAAVTSLTRGLLMPRIRARATHKPTVSKIPNPVKRELRQRSVQTVQQKERSIPASLLEQAQINYELHVDVIQYLKNLGYSIDTLLAKCSLDTCCDFYSELVFVKLIISSQTQQVALPLLVLFLRRNLGHFQQSTQVSEVQRWVQLLSDIKYFVNKDEIMLHFLLQHLSQSLIQWNCQQFLSPMTDVCDPIVTLTAKQAAKFVQQWPDLASTLVQGAIVGQKLIQSIGEAMKEIVWKNPERYLRKTKFLDIYLKKPDPNKYLANLWKTDDIIHMLKSLSMSKKVKKLECQLALKAIDVATPSAIIFILPQLFQSLRVDREMGNLIGDFLIRKSMQHVSVAHNVLWFCGVESTPPDKEEQSKRKVPLPRMKEDNLPAICQKLMTIIKGKLSRRQREFFDTETTFFEKVTSISGLLSPHESKDQKKMKIKEQLIQYNQDIPECVYLPTNQNCKVVSIVTTSGTPMQSAARVPILISFEVEDYPGPDHDEILKISDELTNTYGPDESKFTEATLMLIKATLMKFAEIPRPDLADCEIDEQTYNCNSDDNFKNEANLSQLKQIIAPHRRGGLFQRCSTVVSSILSGQSLDKQDELEDERFFMKEVRQQAFQQNETVALQNAFLTRNKSEYQRSGPKFKRQLSTLLHKDAKPKSQPKNTKTISCIFKVNDDLRQDILALQFIKHFQTIFEQNDLDLFVFPYRCISNRTGSDKLLGGIIEVVPNSHSRNDLGKAFEINLHEYFLKRFGSQSTPEFQEGRHNFIKSLAAYAVVSYILQIKDRHNGNILVDDAGHLIHIDFGFIFDWSPAKDIGFESAAFKLTQEFIDILGGDTKSQAFKLFESKVIQGFLAVRQHAGDFLNFTDLMQYAGFPCFKPASLQNLEGRFKLDMSQAEAAKFMSSLVHDAANKWTTRVYDLVQYKQNKIVF